MKILNFIKKNGREITNYVFWGVILTCILPMWTNYILKKYENHVAFNRFVYEQGLKPYRNKQIECSHKSLDLISKEFSKMENWLLIKEIADKYITVKKRYFLPIEEEKLIIFLIKEIRNIDKEIVSLINS